MVIPAASNSGTSGNAFTDKDDSTRIFNRSIGLTTVVQSILEQKLAI